MEDRDKLELISSIIEDTIKCQENKLKLAEARKNDFDWLKAYDMINLCEQIKSVIDGKIDLEE